MAGKYAADPVTGEWAFGGYSGNVKTGEGMENYAKAQANAEAGISPTVAETAQQRADVIAAQQQQEYEEESAWYKKTPTDTKDRSASRIAREVYVGGGTVDPYLMQRAEQQGTREVELKQEFTIKELRQERQNVAEPTTFLVVSTESKFSGTGPAVTQKEQVYSEATAKKPFTSANIAAKEQPAPVQEEPKGLFGILDVEQTKRLESVFQAYGAGTDITVGFVTGVDAAIKEKIFGGSVLGSREVRPFAELNVKTGLGADAPELTKAMTQRETAIAELETYQKSYDFEAAQASLALEAKKNVNAEGKWAGSPASLEIYNQNVRTYNERVAQGERLQQRVLETEAAGVKSGAFIYEEGALAVNPEKVRTYGAFSDWGRGASNVMMERIGISREKLAAYEVTKKSDFDKNPVEAFVYGYGKQVFTQPEVIVASAISGVQFSAAGGVVSRGLGAISGGSGTAARVATATLSGARSVPARVAVPAVLGGTVVYQSTEGFTLSPGESAMRLGAASADLTAMGVGAAAPAVATRSVQALGSMGTRGVSAIKAKSADAFVSIKEVPELVSERVFAARQRASGIQNIGVRSGTEFTYDVAATRPSPFEPSARATADTARYTFAEQTMGRDFPRLEPTNIREVALRQQMIGGKRTTVTTEAFKFGELSYEQTDPTGRKTTIKFDPFKLAESGYDVSGEAWTMRPEGSKTITRTENIVINPITGDVLIRQEATTAFTPSAGKTLLQRSVGSFNIYNLPPEVRATGVGAEPAFPVGAVRSIRFEGTQRFGFKPSIEIERLEGETGKISGIGRELRISPEGEITAESRIVPTLETSRAISDIINLESPETARIPSYLKPSPRRLAEAERTKAAFEESPLQAMEESPALVREREARLQREGIKLAAEGKGVRTLRQEPIKSPYADEIMASAKQFQTETRIRNAAKFEMEKAQRGRQQIILEGKSPMAESFKSTMSSIREELNRPRTFRRVTPASTERAMARASEFQKGVIARNIAAEPETWRRFEESQRYIPTEADTGRIVDTSESARVSRAMMRVYRDIYSGGGTVSRVSPFITTGKESENVIDSSGFEAGPSGISERERYNPVSKFIKELEGEGSEEDSRVDIITSVIPVQAPDLAQGIAELTERATEQTIITKPITEEVPELAQRPAEDVFQRMRGITLETRDYGLEEPWYYGGSYGGGVRPGAFAFPIGGGGGYDRASYIPRTRTRVKVNPVGADLLKAGTGKLRNLKAFPSGGFGKMKLPKAFR